MISSEEYRAAQFTKIANRHNKTHQATSLEELVKGDFEGRKVTVAGFLFADKDSHKGLFSNGRLNSSPPRPGNDDTIITVTNFTKGDLVNGEYLLLAGTLKGGVFHVEQLSNGSTDPLATKIQKIKDRIFGF